MYSGDSQNQWDAYGRDQDFHEKTSFDNTRAKAYAGKYGNSYNSGHGHGKGAQGKKWQGASASDKQSAQGYDNDAWSKQAYGEDTDSRWGKSYDSVKARSYENQEYARWL